MCGIVGAWVQSGVFRVSRPYLDQMRDTMSHRGPDGAGTWIAADGRIGLAHRRLAIVDRSAAASQPLSNEDETLWITFNGEIYNHREIRAELECGAAHQWKTDHADTEVILHAYEAWGLQCVDRLRGMFAFGLWDARRRRLWLVRDRLGLKPLYYSVHHGRITFASEVKALLADPDQPRVINEEALFHYLTFLSTPPPYTMFEGVRKLAAGSWLLVGENGSMQEQRYWDVWDHTEDLSRSSEAECAERLRTELATAVTQHSHADVPIGVFLSGGIDSSTITALMAQNQHEPIDTFSIEYDQDYGSCRSELPYARKMAEAVGAQRHEITIGQDDLLRTISRIIELQDDPIADPVCFPLYFLARRARQSGVPVCLVGEGGDELFCGYDDWVQRHQAARWSGLVPKWVQHAAVPLLQVAGMDLTGYYELLRRGAAGSPIFWSGAEGFYPGQKQLVLSPRMRKKFAGRSSWEAVAPVWCRFHERAREQTPLNWMTYVDLNIRLPELMLMRVDKMLMGASVEPRVPFLDHKVVELVLSIPEKIRFKDAKQKYILKESVRDLLPQDLLTRPKQGFSVPIHEWYFTRYGEMAKGAVDEFCRQTDLLDSRGIDRLLRSRPERASLWNWHLLTLALWWKRNIAGLGAAAVAGSSISTNGPW